jgi:hypothetical protein
MENRHDYKFLSTRKSKQYIGIKFGSEAKTNQDEKANYYPGANKNCIYPCLSCMAHLLKAEKLSNHHFC